MIRRRDFVAASGAALLQQPARATSNAPVAIQRCRTYRAGLEPTMRRLFDGIGGLGRVVKNKTVTVKVNLTGRPGARLGNDPAELTHWTHPRIVGMAVFLMAEAGARRIRVVESPWSTAEPLDLYMKNAGWDPAIVASAAKNVGFENTNHRGKAKDYARFSVPGVAHLFPAYDLNPAYADCDAFVSIAKLKEHSAVGITASMKNCFGITPCTIYGDGAGIAEPSLLPSGTRAAVLHTGSRPPSRSAPQELNPESPRNYGYRVPRIVADLCAARPVDLAIVDAVETIAGGEGPWISGVRRCRPSVIIAGTNVVSTDAVSAAVLGFDPMAARGAAPFENCDSTLALGEAHGIGTRDVRGMEIAGAQIADIRYDIRKVA